MKTHGGVTFVDSTDTLAKQVASFLTSEGLTPGSSSGISLEFGEGAHPSSDSIGIIQRDPYAQPKPRLFGLMKPERIRGRLIGAIWFRNYFASKTEVDEEHWLFKVYGRNNLAAMKKLASEMASTFHVKINLELADEAARSEDDPSYPPGF